MSRAGLVSLVIFFGICISLTASAPLPKRFSSLLERYDDYDNDFVARSPATLLDRGFNLAADPGHAKREYLSALLDDRGFDIEDHEYTKREYDDPCIFDAREFGGIEHEYTKRDEFDLDVLHRRSFWSRIKKGFQKAGSAVRGGFHKVQAGVRKAGGAMRKGIQKAGGAMRKGFGKAGKFLKKNGAIIGKFGLKVIATGATVASKLVKFVPGAGTVLSMGLKGVAMGANDASNKIHAHLPGGLEKASEGMDMVMNPVAAASKLGGGAGKVIGIVDSII